MNRTSVNKAVAEAKRFIAAANQLLGSECPEYDHITRTYRKGKWKAYESPKEQGAVRRASMDLTRALAEMRRP